MIVDVREGNLLMNGIPLTEYRPGLFFTPAGEAVEDFRKATPTFRNILLSAL